MTMTDFWKKWRAEIVRGAVIFTIVVAGGVFLVSAFNRAKTGLASGFRSAARSGGLAQLAQGIDQSFGGSFNDPGRTHGDAWTWHSRLNAGQTLAIRNLNGPVEVTQASGTETVVTTEKSWLSSDSASVQIQVVPTSSGAMICAIWPGSTGSECTAGHNINYHRNGHDHNDVAVKFTIQLARGVKLDVGSVTGDVDVEGASAPVTVNTVTGDLSIQTSAWPVQLTTVTGDISATTGAPGSESAKVTAVTGDVSLDIPSSSNLVVTAHTTAGDINNDFSLPVTEQKYGPSQSLTGTLGSGGAKLELNTVTGDITLNKAGAAKLSVVKVKNHGVTSVHVTPPPAPAPVVRP